jgi:acetolactate synthase small subunit
VIPGNDYRDPAEPKSRARILQSAPILPVIGDTDKIDALEKLLRQYGIKEFVRTGTVGILRGSKTVTSGK